MGVRQKEHKMSSRDAASLMKIYGTVAAYDRFRDRKINADFWKVSEPDGLPHFRAEELLHHTVINSLFSGAKAAAVAKFQNMIAKAKIKAGQTEAQQSVGAVLDNQQDVALQNILDLLEGDE